MNKKYSDTEKRKQKKSDKIVRGSYIHNVYVTALTVLLIIAAIIYALDILAAIQIRKLNDQPLAVSASARPKGYSYKVSPIEITHGDKTKRQVIFTFDGGDGAQSAEQILAALKAHGVKGTFFLTGKFVEANPDLVRRIVAAGNEIFSHTYDHPHMTLLSKDQIIAEMTGMEKTLASTTGMSPKPFMRFPYGDRDSRTVKIVADDGYQSVYWTVDARDWEESKGETADQVESRILKNVAPGTIYLMHFGDTITGKILDDVFTKIEKQGYKMVSLTQGLTPQ